MSTEIGAKLKSIFIEMDVCFDDNEHNEPITLDSLQFAMIISEIEYEFQISITSCEMLALTSACFNDFQHLIYKKISER